jgi:HEAT repeat protein
MVLNKYNITKALAFHVKEFKTWLDNNYSQEDIACEKYEAAAYPKWNEIEKIFESAFLELDFSTLKTEVLEDISFLIAMQWDIGIIFPYFKEEISQIGMTEEQLLILAEFGLKYSEWSFRQQCAASLGKVKKNTPKAIEIASKYFEEHDADIRRHALNSLYKLGDKNIHHLLKKAWSFDDEMEKMLCLQIWQEIDKTEFNARLSEAKKDARKYIKKYVDDLNPI